MDNSSTPGLTEEYNLINIQIVSYIMQRTSALALVIAGFGAILAFGTEANSVVLSLALYSVILAGSLITWNCCFQALRRAAYLIVFIEPNLDNRKWYTRLYADTNRGIIFSLFSRDLTIRSVFIPNEFSCIYIAMGVTAFIASYLHSSNNNSQNGLLISLSGLICVLIICVLIQLVNSDYGFYRLKIRWQQQKALEETERKNRCEQKF